MKKQEVIKPVENKVKYRYVCPACTNNAIFCSGKMLGVKITCMSCGKEIILDNPNNFIKLK